jgi:hypothetical protein
MQASMATTRCSWSCLSRILSCIRVQDELQYSALLSASSTWQEQWRAASMLLVPCASSCHPVPRTNLQQQQQHRTLQFST